MEVWVACGSGCQTTNQIAIAKTRDRSTDREDMDTIRMSTRKMTLGCLCLNDVWDVRRNGRSDKDGADRGIGSDRGLIGACVVPRSDCRLRRMPKTVRFSLRHPSTNSDTHECSLLRESECSSTAQVPQFINRRVTSSQGQDRSLL